MMMDKERQREKVLQKTEACDFVAGVVVGDEELGAAPSDEELGAAPSAVTVTGDNNNNVVMMTREDINGSKPGRIHENHPGLVGAVVTTSFGTVNRKKRMARQRRSNNTTLIKTHTPPSSSSHVPPSSPVHPPRKLPARVSPFFPFIYLFIFSFYLLFLQFVFLNFLAY